MRVGGRGGGAHDTFSESLMPHNERERSGKKKGETKCFSSKDDRCRPPE